MGYTGSVKITVSIPDDVLRKADLLAKRMKLSRSRLVATAVQRFVGPQSEADLVDALDKVFGPAEAAPPKERK